MGGMELEAPVGLVLLCLTGQCLLASFAIFAWPLPLPVERKAWLTGMGFASTTDGAVNKRVVEIVSDNDRKSVVSFMVEVNAVVSCGG